jgi:hypothetical protein
MGVSGVWFKTRIDKLEKSARLHERKFEFDAAAHLYFRSAMLSELGTRRFSNLMRAASCKERAQNWRQQSGLWERLAYELAKSIGRKFPPQMEAFRARKADNGQLGIFHIISYDEWASPTGGLIQLVQGEEDNSLHALQRAWAYQWAAEEAEANGRLAYAARLWRLAGLSFMDPLCPLKDRQRDAARSFLHGATCTLRAGEWVETMFVATVPWDADAIEWGDPDPETIEKFRRVRAMSALNEIRSQGRTDIGWHQFAWDTFLAGINDPTSRRDALEERARELKQIQQLLIAAGDRPHGVEIYRKRMQIDIKVARLYHQWKQSLLKQLYYWTSRSGSSAVIPLFIALIVNAGVLPLLYWSTGAAYAGTSGTHRASFVDTLILSLANVVSLSTSRAYIAAQWASALQTLQAISGYVILAFVLWVALRFSEQ